MNIMYDIDSLFVIKKASHKEAAKDYNRLISKYIPSHVSSDALIVGTGEYYGFRNNSALYVGDKALPFYLNTILNSLEGYLTSKAQLMKGTAGNAERSEIRKSIAEAEADLLELAEFAVATAQNTLVDEFSGLLQDMKNRRDLNTPITTARVSDIKENIKKELIENLDDPDFINELISAGLIEKCN